MKRTILVLLLFVTCVISQAQVRQISHYSIEEGLSQSVVNCVFQDSKGFIWFGTQDGINRYDGYNFVSYIHSPIDTNSISNNWIYAIDEDRNGDLWIGTKFGLQKYEINAGHFKHFETSSDSEFKLFNNVVYGVLSDGDVLWINTPPVLSKINVKNKHIDHYRYSYQDVNSISDQAFPIIKDSDNNIWVCSPVGLHFFDINRKQFQSFTEQSSSFAKISDDFVNSVVEDHNHTIWVGTQNGLSCLTKDVSGIYKVTAFTSTKKIGEFIRTVFVDTKRNIWIGTEHSGLFKTEFNDAKGTLQVKEHYKSGEDKKQSLSHDNILCLLEDKSNILWIGTLLGIDKLDLKPQKFKLYQKSNSDNSIDLIDNVMASIYVDENFIWVGNWGKGLNIINKKTKEVKHYSTTLPYPYNICNDFVHVLFKDNFNNFYIGTRNGIQIFDSTKNKFVAIQEFYKTTSIPDFKFTRIYSIEQDQDNNLWIGTQNGLYIIDIINKKTNYIHTNSKKTKISDNLIYKIIEDQDGDIWIATANGLDMYSKNKQQIIHYKHEQGNINSLCDNFTISLCIDFENNIWIGTKSGVNKYLKSENRFLYYSEKDKLPSNIVYEIIDDSNNDLWFSTGHGLARFDRTSGSFVNYSVADGLQSMEFNLNVVFKADDGELFFGGMNGFNSFYPDSLAKNPNIPNVVLTEFSYHNEKGKQELRVESLNEALVKYSDHSFNIEFASLEFTNSSQNNYAYYIQGLTDEWVDIGNRNFISFSNFPHGDYLLKIKGSNNDGIWNEKGMEIGIHVKPPWWKTIFAYGSYIIIGILGIFIFIKIREKKLVRERNILEQKVQVRTAEIVQKNELLIQQKEEIITQNEEIKAQRDLATNQFEQISEQKKSITDSIQYAKRIQTAIMPPINWLSEVFPESFVIFKPRDIVSGDFYWSKRIDKFVLIAVVDCTGHGVPGAMVSMLGAAILNEIVRRQEVTKASHVLDILREEIKRSLNQKGESGEQKDGMDISLCVIDTEKFVLQFSGANSPIFLIRNNELMQIKGDNMPIGIFYVEKPFTNHEIVLQNNDQIYLATDGFVDQFGGEKERKFLTKNFKSHLLKNQHLPFGQQKKKLIEVFNNWKGDVKQIDDVTVVGFKYSM